MTKQKSSRLMIIFSTIIKKGERCQRSPSFIILKIFGIRKIIAPMFGKIISPLKISVKFHIKSAFKNEPQKAAKQNKILYKSTQNLLFVICKSAFSP